MSFKQNDNTPSRIHLGNYEEFFLLYLDNELDAGDLRMVDEFLAKNPDLKAEFEMLKAVRLPMDELTMDKTMLTSEAMKHNVIEEDILLYIDNELPAGKRQAFEQRLASSEELRTQLAVMVRTKLDPEEALAFPYKNDLYKKEGRRVLPLAPWMRIAAAVIVIVTVALFYMSDSTGPVVEPGPSLASGGIRNLPGSGDAASVKQSNEKNSTVSEKDNELNLATQTPGKEHGKETKGLKEIDRLDIPEEIKRNIDLTDEQTRDMARLAEDPEELLRPKTTIIKSSSFSANLGSPVLAAHSENINTSPVTNMLASRKTDITSAPVDEKADDAAGNKGLVKGLLRRATRLIEKKTSIDPTNDGELLIGAVAINLN